MVTENRKEFKVCSGDTLARFSGLELCGELQFPNASLKTTGPFFPFTGPSAFSIVLYKKDTHTGYKLLAKRVEVSHRHNKGRASQTYCDIGGALPLKYLLKIILSLRFEK